MPFKDPEQRRAYIKAHYDANGEKYRERSRQHYQDNIEQRRVNRKTQYWADPETARQKTKEWQQDNPDLFNANGHARRARKRQAVVERVETLVVLELDDGVCGICGDDVDPSAFDLDHVIPLSRGGEHSYANVQVSHPRCNRQKGTKLPWLI